MLANILAETCSLVFSEWNDVFTDCSIHLYLKQFKTILRDKILVFRVLSSKIYL